MELFYRRRATEAELEEGRRQIEEAERRMVGQGIEVVWRDGPGGDAVKRTLDDDPGFSTPNLREAPRSTARPAVCDEVAPLDQRMEGRSGEVVQSEDETELREVEAEVKRAEGWGSEGPRQDEDRRVEVGGVDLPSKTPEETLRMPLFTEEQLRRLEQLERSAPLLFRQEPQIPRPRWMMEEEKKVEEMRKEQEKMRELREQQRIAAAMKDEHKAQILEKLFVLEKENGMMKKAWEETQAENKRMKEKLRILAESPTYETPKEEFPWKEDPKREGGCEGEAKGGFETPNPRRTGEGEKKGLNEMSMELMVKMMDSMQKMMTKKNVSPEMETVRSGHSEIPKLAEWSVESAPLDLGDWLIMLDPVMGDLSSTSHVWWQMTMEEARNWYERHQTLSPLDRVSHKPKPSENLAEAKWMRLERRASSLLLSALPDIQKEEMVATKNLTPLSMVTRLMTIYQPGGLSEKAIILKALEQPQEASCLSSALVGLRRWLRWKRRASEVQVALPDASVLVKGCEEGARGQ